MTKTPRNVILLSFDALRADHLGCYGYERDTSPNLDSFAEENLQFLNAYSASSHTREAVPALLTGEYPDVAIDANYHLATDTIASTLSEEGSNVATALAGEGVQTAGFHSNPFVSRAYGFDRGFDTFDDDLHFGSNKVVALAQRAFDKLRNRHYARADEINERSLSWLDSLDDGQPFFLWSHYMDTHGPYEPPGEYRQLYADADISNGEAQSLYQRAIKDPESITDDERQLLIDLYDSEIRYNDEKIGVFLDELRERGLLDQSLIVVTADHGDAFGEHGYYEHPRYLHDEITHVPLLVRSPGGDEGTVSTSVSTLDIAPTVTSETDSTEGFEGESLHTLEDSDRTMFMQARGENEHSHVRRYALRAQAGACFCERDRDAEEISFSDCASDVLRERLESHVEARVRRENGDEATEADDVDEEIDRRLEALGYKE